MNYAKAAKQTSKTSAIPATSANSDALDNYLNDTSETNPVVRQEAQEFFRKHRTQRTHFRTARRDTQYLQKQHSSHLAKCWDTWILYQRIAGPKETSIPKWPKTSREKQKKGNKKGSENSKTNNIDPILKSPQKQMPKSTYTFRSWKHHERRQNFKWIPHVLRTSTTMWTLPKCNYFCKTSNWML